MSLKSKPLFKKNFIRNIQSKKFGLVSSEWNSEIINRLLDGVFKFFNDVGIKRDSILQYKVPGSFELIYGCAKMKKNNDLDAIIAIGSIIKGETKHFDFISQSVCDGIKDLNINADCPIILCLLTDDNYEQSLDRSGGKHGNKGYDCAEAAVKITLI